MKEILEYLNGRYAFLAAAARSRPEIILRLAEEDELLAQKAHGLHTDIPEEEGIENIRLLKNWLFMDPQSEEDRPEEAWRSRCLHRLTNHVDKAEDTSRCVLVGDDLPTAILMEAIVQFNFLHRGIVVLSLRDVEGLHPSWYLEEEDGQFSKLRRTETRKLICECIRNAEHTSKSWVLWVDSFSDLVPFTEVMDLDDCTYFVRESPPSTMPKDSTFYLDQDVNWVPIGGAKSASGIKVRKKVQNATLVPFPRDRAHFIAELAAAQELVEPAQIDEPVEELPSTNVVVERASGDSSSATSDTPPSRNAQNMKAPEPVESEPSTKRVTQPPSRRALADPKDVRVTQVSERGQRDQPVTGSDKPPSGVKKVSQPQEPQSNPHRLTQPASPRSGEVLAGVTGASEPDNPLHAERRRLVEKIKRYARQWDPDGD